MGEGLPAVIASNRSEGGAKALIAELPQQRASAAPSHILWPKNNCLVAQNEAGAH